MTDETLVVLEHYREKMETWGTVHDIEGKAQITEWKDAMDKFVPVVELHQQYKFRISLWTWPEGNQTWDDLVIRTFYREVSPVVAVNGKCRP